MTENKTFDIDFSFKKNNVDELFFNLSENPEGFKNKDFRYTLSLIYQTVEDEFKDVFLSPYTPARNTHFFLVNENDKLSFFVTPTNNFEYYLKSKGSLFKFRSQVMGDSVGYPMSLDLVMDYFGGFGDVVDLEAVTPTFIYMNNLTHFVMKMIEKLYFIPTVKTRGQMFRIVYEPIISNQQLARIINTFEENIPDNLFIKGEKPKNFVKDFIYNYLNYVLYKFLGIKAYKFKDVKSGTYMIKDLEQRSQMKGMDIAENFSQWFDELYLGKYDVIPFFKIDRVEDELFRLKVHIKNRKTGESVLVDDLYTKDEIFGANSSDISRIVEKQLNYAIRYMPELEELFEDESKLALDLNLNEVYKIITQTAYYLQKAQIEVILPKELVNIVVPRASINAKVKAARSKDLADIFNNTSSSKIALDDILDFVRTAKPLNPVFVDCTASYDLPERYLDILNAGMHIATPNKRANSMSMKFYHELRSVANRMHRRFLYETNVGAGLPIIDTLQNLFKSGDQLTGFSGIMSGSLSYIFGRLDEGATFSEAVIEARNNKFTEPDPRDDLGGLDVARKALIIAREAGMSLELQDVTISKVFPQSFDDSGSVEEFMERLPQVDAYFEKKMAELKQEGKVLRMAASIEEGKCRVGIIEVGPDHPLYAVRGGENAFVFTTRRYNPIPLSVRGYGAGAGVTAAGVFGDILRTVSWNPEA